MLIILHTTKKKSVVGCVFCVGNIIVVLQASWIGTMLPPVEDCEMTATTGTKTYSLIRRQWEDKSKGNLKIIVLSACLALYSTEITDSQPSVTTLN